MADNGNTSGGVARTGTQAGLVDSLGNSSQVSVLWDTSNTWSLRPNAVPADGNAQLFKGYLDTTDTSTTTVNITDIPYLVYDAYVYFDGGNTTNLSGFYAVNDGVSPVQSEGPYLDSANWPIEDGGYAFIEAKKPGDTGNVAAFTGLRGTSLTITATPDNRRAPINAIQIVAVVPELVVNSTAAT